MFKRFFSFSLILLIVGLSPISALASILEENSDFNPNYIISDEEMQDWRSLNEVEIDIFLKNKGGYIANAIFTDENGLPASAASLIARSARKYQINPKYLLVKLQKEQSLITDKNPSQRQLDWATGYGVCDSCSTDDPLLQKFKGFATQIDDAAGIMRWYYDNMSLEPWIKRANSTYIIDGTSVTPSTNATGFLYSYTPHLHGNQNFWQLWKDWFAQAYPDGTLIKVAGSPGVYVLRAGKKHAITSMTVLKSRYNEKLIVTIPESEMNFYDDGEPVKLPNYSVVATPDKTYLLVDDTKRPFADSYAFSSLGYNPDELISVTDNDLSSYELGEPITAGVKPSGQLVKINETGSIYFIENNVAHPLADMNMARLIYPRLAVDKVSSSALENVTIGEPPAFPDGTLVGAKETKKIYVSEHKKLRHITSEQAFSLLGYKIKNVVWFSATALSVYSPGAPISVPHR